MYIITRIITFIHKCVGVCMYKQYLTFGSDLFLIEFRTMSQSLSRGNVHVQVHLKASAPTSTKGGDQRGRKLSRRKGNKKLTAAWTALTIPLYHYHYYDYYCGICKNLIIIVSRRGSSSEQGNGECIRWNLIGFRQQVVCKKAADHHAQRELNLIKNRWRGWPKRKRKG